MGVGDEPDLLDRLERQWKRRHGVHVVGQHQGPARLGDEGGELGLAVSLGLELGIVEVVADQ